MLAVLGWSGDTIKTLQTKASGLAEALTPAVTTIPWPDMVAKAPAITSAFQEAENEKAKQKTCFLPFKETYGHFILYFCFNLIGQALRQTATLIHQGVRQIFSYLIYTDFFFLIEAQLKIRALFLHKRGNRMLEKAASSLRH